MNGEDPAPKRKKAANSHMRLSGIGFQMAAIIGIGAYGGWWADQRTGWKFPVLTLVGSLGGVAIAMYILFKETASGKGGTYEAQEVMILMFAIEGPCLHLRPQEGGNSPRDTQKLLDARRIPRLLPVDRRMVRRPA
ncbi:MAG: AtpZ/AtpI family protein [Flavobacteriales bacterium]|nr:AtpZ/AtpI family protein [Flavobacteriales bacterium]